MTSYPAGGGGPPPSPGSISGARFAVTPYATGGLSTALTVLLATCAMSSLASGLLSYRRAGVLRDLRVGEPPSAATIDAADVAVAVSAVGDAALTVATGIVFIVWFWRAIKNAQRLAPRGYSSAGIGRASAPAAGWAIGSWLIPIANAVLPAYFLSRVDRISGREGSGARPLIVCWAILFGFASLISRVIWRSTATDLVGLEIADRRDIWPALVYVAAALVAILMVRRMTERQQLALAGTTPLS